MKVAIKTRTSELSLESDRSLDEFVTAITERGGFLVDGAFYPLHVIELIQMTEK
jgi:hypothetical protein